MTHDIQPFHTCVKGINGKDLGGIEIGGRPNVDLGNRFRYRWAVEEKGHFDIFMAIVQFGEGLTLCVIVSAEAIHEQEGSADEWIRVKDWAERKFHESWLYPENTSGRVDLTL